MSWVGVLPAVITAILLLYIPGALIAGCLKFRLGTVLGLAPLLSTAALGFAGVIGGVLGVPWGILPFLLLSALLAVCALLLTRRLPWRLANAGRLQYLPLAALAVATASVTWRFIDLVGSPNHPSQVFDNVFHLNAIRFILDTGNASSLTLASLQGATGINAVYPAAWHSYAALLVQLTGVDIPTAENALNLVIAAVLWPASCLFLVVKTVSRRPAALLIAAVVAVTQVAFPFLMLVWGPLFPYALAVSMLPAALTCLAALVRFGRTRTDPWVSWALALLLALAGLAFAHTSSINTVLALSVPFMAIIWWRLAHAPGMWQPGNYRTWAFGAATLGVLVLAAGLWFKLRPAPYDNWGPTVKPGAAVGEILTVSPMQSAIPAVVVSVLSIVGLLAVFRTRRHRWLAACYAVTGALYVIAASFPEGRIRDALIGTWYQDTYRLAALLPLLATPLAVVGGLRLWDSWRDSRQAALLSRFIAKRFTAATHGRTLLAAATAVVFTVLATFAGPLGHYISGAATVYRFDEGSELLTPDEHALLERLPRHVPPDAVIANNPWNGSSLAYAYANRQVLTAHLFATADPATEAINRQLGEPGAGEALCDAAESKNVQFVLDFGSRYLIDLPGSDDYPGVTAVEQGPHLELVDSQGGNAKLYRLSGCD